MIGKRRTVQALVLTAALALAGVGSASGNGQGAWPLWKMIRLKSTSALVLSGFVDVSAYSQGETTHLETMIRAKLFGVTIARTHTRSTLDSKTLLPTEYLAFSTKRGRHYLFGESGYEVRFLDPPKDPDLPLDDWVVKGNATFDYPLTEDGSQPVPVYDYYGVILLLQNLDIDEVGDEVTVWVATSDGPVPYGLRVVESREELRNYRELPGKEKRSATVTELMLKIIPLIPDEEQGFLGMEGETEIWIEQRTRTLVQISGKAPTVGHVNIKLTHLERM